MIKRLFIIARISLIILVSNSLQFCHSEKSIPVVDVEAAMKNMEKIFLSNYVENIRYVPLDMKVLYNNANPEISNNYILTSDGKTCYLHDASGKLISNIGRNGRGPGEYGGVKYRFLIRDKIFLVDIAPDDILKFTLDGTFIAKFRSGFTAKGQKYRFNNALIINDSTIIGGIANWNGKEIYKALVINFDGEVIHSYKNYDFFDLQKDVKQVTSPRPIITLLNDYVYFKEYYNDTLFQLNEDYQLSPKLVFNLGRYKEPVQNRGENIFNIDRNSYFSITSIFYLDENKMIFGLNLNDHFPAKRLTQKTIVGPLGDSYTTWYNSRLVIGIYNFKNNTLVFSEPSSTDDVLATTGFYNDIDAGPKFFPGNVSNGSIMVMHIGFDRLVDYVNSDYFKDFIPKFPEKKERLKLFVDSLSTAGFSNPILMIVTMKDQR